MCFSAPSSVLPSIPAQVRTPLWIRAFVACPQGTRKLISHILRPQEPKDKLAVWSKVPGQRRFPSAVPGSNPPSLGLTSGPFLLDLLLKDALFFFLLALRVFCKGSRGVSD